VYGVDINYLAVELAKVVMRIKTFEEDTPLQFLDANLKWGNSLIGTTVDEMFESDKMKNLNQLFNDMQRASHKATQAVQKVASSIDEYIA
jgi:type II restriction/modification system DNA methylase subunit YeeA